MRAITLLIIIISSLFNLASRPYQQAGIQFVDISQEWVFGEKILFNATIQSASPVHEIGLYIRPFGADTQLIEIEPGLDSKLQYTLDLTRNSIRPFSQVEYWFQVKLKTGEEGSSQVFSFLYEDNRYDWQRMESDQFDIAWVSGDNNFGQTLMNAAGDSLTAAQAILPVEPPSPLRIYVYPSAAEMQSTVDLVSSPWSAGHASPDLSVIMISIPAGPDAKAEMERQLPHEIMHLLEYQILGTKYDHAPMWLLEGLASAAELYPNPEYQQVLENAIDEDSLIPIIVLCDSFPRDLSGAILAYAESNSFVRFLYQNYGSSGISSLLNQYRDGLRCEAGVQAALDTSLVQVEGRWQSESLGHNAWMTAWKQIRPYLLLASIILIPVGLSLIPNRSKRQRQED